MKIHLLHAEHFSTPGLIVKAFTSRTDAVKEAVDLVNVMLKDNGDEPVANSATWERHIEQLQDEHGAQYCYVEINEKALEGRNPLVAVVKDALEYEADQFDGDPDMPLEVSGADTVDWFTGWREEAKDALRKVGAA